MNFSRVLLSLVFCMLSASSAISQSPKDLTFAQYGKLPLSFEANEGQTNASVKFLSRGHGYSLFLTSKEAVMVLKKAAPTSGAVLRMQLLGAKSAGVWSGADELPGKANYFIGNDPSKWRANVPTYGKVKYEGVYPGVDLVYYGNQGQLEYDFVVAPGADPSSIQLKFRGAGKLRLDRNGDLLLGAAGNRALLGKLVVYQIINGEKEVVDGHYVIAAANQVGFRLGQYDHRRALVIDPVLLYSTYLGGSGYNGATAIAVDSSGNTYITGSTNSSNFPTVNALQSTLVTIANSVDTFVSKFNATGSALLYSTYLGGIGSNFGSGIAVDAEGNAYITGAAGAGFPTTNALQSSLVGSTNAFVTKLNATGSALIYSTYLGGSGYTYGASIAVDAEGNAYITGLAGIGFPTANALQSSLAGSANAFVTKLNVSGSALIYSTYLGGNGSDIGSGIAVDASGNAYVTGGTNSTNFPTVNALQPTLATVLGNSNAFVSKLNATGSALIYSTYLGGNGDDSGGGIAVDAAENAYVTGYTSSTNFPTANALQPARGGSGSGFDNAFVSKLNTSGSALVYSTYLGGSEPGPQGGRDWGLGIAVDASGNAYITGTASTTDFPTSNALQSSLVGSTNAFVTKLNVTGSALIYSTYLGGDGSDTGYGIAVDALGNAYITGRTTSTDFPTVNAFQPDLVGDPDAFVAKIAPDARSIKESVQGQLLELLHGATEHDSRELREAFTHLSSSLLPMLWRSGNQLNPYRGRDVFGEEEEAVKELDKLLDDKYSTTSIVVLQGYINGLVEADRILASVAINDALGLDPGELARADKYLAEGDQDATSGRFREAISHYEEAWWTISRGLDGN